MKRMIVQSATICAARFIPNGFICISICVNPVHLRLNFFLIRSRFGSILPSVGTLFQSDHCRRQSAPAPAASGNSQPPSAAHPVPSVGKPAPALREQPVSARKRPSTAISQAMSEDSQTVSGNSQVPSGNSQAASGTSAPLSTPPQLPSTAFHHAAHTG